MKDYVFSNVGALHFGMALLSSGMRVFWQKIRTILVLEPKVLAK